MKLFKRAVARDVELCERCGEVCDAECRAKQAFDRARTEALRHGIRVA